MFGVYVNQPSNQCFWEAHIVGVELEKWFFVVNGWASCPHGTDVCMESWWISNWNSRLMANLGVSLSSTSKWGMGIYSGHWWTFIKLIPDSAHFMTVSPLQTSACGDRWSMCDCHRVLKYVQMMQGFTDEAIIGWFFYLLQDEPRNWLKISSAEKKKTWYISISTINPT